MEKDCEEHIDPLISPHWTREYSKDDKLMKYAILPCIFVTTVIPLMFCVCFTFSVIANDFDSTIRFCCSHNNKEQKSQNRYILLT